MVLYYLQTEFAIGKHRIVNAVYDKDIFAFDESNMSAFSVLPIDEIAPTNKDLCLSIAKTVNDVDAVGEGKYYINSAGELMGKDGWVEWSPVI